MSLQDLLVAILGLRMTLLLAFTILLVIRNRNMTDDIINLERFLLGYVHEEQRRRSENDLFNLKCNRDYEGFCVLQSGTLTVMLYSIYWVVS